MGHAPHIAPMGDVHQFFRAGEALLSRQFLDHRSDFIQHFFQLEWLLVENDLPAFQFPHVQHFIDELQEEGRSAANFLPALCLLLHVVLVVVRHFDHADDAIDGRANVVAHALQKFGLRPVRRLGFFRSRHDFLMIERFFFLFLLPMLRLGVGQQRPCHAEGDEVEEHDDRHILREWPPHRRIGQVGEDVVIPLLQHDAVSIAALHIHHVMAVFAVLQRLHPRQLVGIAADEASVIGRDDHAIIGNQNGPILRRIVAGENVLHRQIIHEGVLGRRVVIHRHYAFLVDSSAGRHVDIAAGGKVDAVTVNFFRIFRRIQRRTFFQRGLQKLCKALAAVVFIDDVAVFVQKDDAAQPETAGMAGEHVLIHRLPAFGFHVQIAAHLPRTFHQAEQRLGLGGFVVVRIDAALHLHVVHRIQEPRFCVMFPVL